MNPIIEGGKCLSFNHHGERCLGNDSVKDMCSKCWCLSPAETSNGAVLVLRYYLGLSVSEAARMLHVSPDTVKRLAREAKQRAKRDA